VAPQDHLVSGQGRLAGRAVSAGGLGRCDAPYNADIDDTNLSGQLTLGYRIAGSVNTHATYATSFKSVGLNIAGGLPIIRQPDCRILRRPSSVRRTNAMSKSA
jgi:hypothetical protein